MVFEIPVQREATEVTPESKKYFLETYGINLDNCSTTEVQILIDFHDKSAAFAIMELIGRLQQKVNTEADFELQSIEA